VAALNFYRPVQKKLDLWREDRGGRYGGRFPSFPPIFHGLENASMPMAQGF